MQMSFFMLAGNVCAMVSCRFRSTFLSRYNKIW